MTARSGRCAHGAEWRNCLDWHIREPYGPKRTGNKYLCPSCGEWRLSVNQGSGARVLMTCHNGCSWQQITGAMLSDAVHHTCLGIEPPRPVQPGMPAIACAVTDETVHDAKKYAAIRKLPPDMNLRLRLMCEQAISEGDGDLPPVPEVLLPTEKKAFVALARRAGLTNTWPYSLFDQLEAARSAAGG